MNIETCCPNCERPVSVAELNRCKGVCQFCRQAFRAANKSWVQGNYQAASDQRNSAPSAIEVGMGDEHEPIGISDFDFEAVEKSLGEFHAAPVTAQIIAAEVLARIFVLTFEKRYLRGALLRFTVLMAGIRPDLVNDRTYSAIGLECGVTKQAISKAATKIQDALGIKFARSRSLDARKRMAAKMLGHPDWSKKGSRKKPCSPPDTTPVKESIAG
jgi:hypothetical protein